MSRWGRGPTAKDRALETLSGKLRFGDEEQIKAVRILQLWVFASEIADVCPHESPICDSCDGTGECTCETCSADHECGECAGSGVISPCPCWKKVIAGCPEQMAVDVWLESLRHRNKETTLQEDLFKAVA